MQRMASMPAGILLVCTVGSQRISACIERAHECNHFFWRCARGLLALAVARKRVDEADVREINVWSRK